jgi:hypothetical protein
MTFTDGLNIAFSYDLYETGWKIRQFEAPVLNSVKEKVVKFYIPKIVLKEDTSLF